MTTVVQTADNLYVKQVTIAASASASEVIETGGAVPVSVFTPTAIDGTTTHFKIQSCLTADGTFVDAVNSSGGIVTVPATASKHAQIADAVNAPYIKLVAITSLEAADAQAAERTLQVVLRKYLS
jgi:proteasome assembly chaperone (PAC2) family protein